ncbi:MAG: methylmalonyl-CoA mutase, partial [Chloroflexi bacterium]|nr:methylmalonyl-CoA mutase [Chloroflexota bacterium]
MYDRERLEELSRKRALWEQRSDAERRQPFMTTSGRPIRRLYGPTDVPDLDYERDLGLPGEYPYTRGVHATGYRGK